MTFFALLLKLSFITGGTPPATAADQPRSRYLMGTLLTIEAPTEAASAAFKTVADIESWMSTYKEDSELSTLNAASGTGPVSVSDPLWNVLMEARKYWRLSKGAFDPAYKSEGGFNRIQFDEDNQTVSLPKGLRIDLGGIGKGWALDRAAETLRARGITTARLDFGGQILVFSPSLRRNYRLVEIADPACHRRPLSTGRSIFCKPAETLHLANGSIATAGTIERPDHIVDPKTGKPVKNTGSISVTAPTATAADAWSTAVFAGGLENLPTEKSICALEIKNAAAVWHGDCSNTRRKL